MRRRNLLTPPTSVGLDLAEAVRAVDRPIHSRLERNLGLVATRGADHGEVFARDPIVSPLVASGSPDISNVRSGIAAGPPAGSTARTAFGVGREPLLHVVLLVGRRMNEFDSAVDAGERPIGVGHVALPLPCSRLRSATGRGIGGRDFAKSVGRAGAAYPGADVESLFGAHRCVRRRRIQRVEKSGLAATAALSKRNVRLAAVPTDLSQWGSRFGVASEGQGAPRSHQICRPVGSQPRSPLRP